MILTHTYITDLFHQYREELTRRLVGMVKCRETAADLVQDTYLRLLRMADAQDFQHDLATSQGNELRVIVDYNKALSNLARHIATTLDRYQLELS